MIIILTPYSVPAGECLKGFRDLVGVIRYSGWRVLRSQGWCFKSPIKQTKLVFVQSEVGTSRYIRYDTQSQSSFAPLCIWLCLLQILGHDIYSLVPQALHKDFFSCSITERTRWAQHQWEGPTWNPEDWERETLTFPKQRIEHWPP